MKIVHVVYSLEVGGAEVLVSQLCRLQRAQGHQVWIFSYAHLGVIGEALLAEGFDIYVPGVAPALTTMRRYYKRLRGIRPDVVHCHNVAPTTQAVIPARLVGVPMILSTRHRLELHPYDWSSEAQYNLMGWLCNRITGICQVTIDNIKKGPFCCMRKLVLVYNGTLPVERVDVSALPKRGFTLVFVGRLAPEKMLETLIEAVARVGDKIPGLSFWIVGDGRSRPTLEALVHNLGVQDAVIFWGQQTITAPFFSAADAFVMSSISEGLPMSLLQSMSLGIPAILTDVDGMGEILRLTGGGLLVPVKDVEAMAEAIERLAGDAELYAELSAKALQAYQERFTLEVMAEGYARLYTGQS
jgi:glycosyltransferase involved in cell wall biosynthesis